MSAWFFCLFLLGLAPQDPPDPPPEPARVEATLKELAAGFADEEVVATLRAISGSARTRAPEVAQQLVRHGLKHAERDVRLATVTALGELRLATGRKALEAWLRRDRKLTKDPELMTELLRAIAKHEQVSSLPLLGELHKSDQQPEILRARILCQAKIRDVASVKALIGGMRKVGREDIGRLMAHYRLALMKLTGVDRGLSPDHWWSWWNDNKRGFAVSVQEPKLSPEDRYRWRDFWGLPRETPRPRERQERGK